MCSALARSDFGKKPLEDGVNRCALVTFSGNAHKNLVILTKPILISESTEMFRIFC